MSLRNLRGAVVVITGASSGIGRAAAVAFGRAGATVVLAARSTAALSAAAAEVVAAGGRAQAVPHDVTAPGAAEELVADTLRLHGRIDVLVCSAGAYIRGAVRDSTPEHYAASLRVNFSAAVSLILQALPHMLERRQGHIVAVSSVDGKKGLPLDAPYAAAKFALTGFMDVLRQELCGSGVAASTVLPGRVDTPMIENLRVPLVSAKIRPERVARALLRAVRRGRPEVIVPWSGPKLLVVASAVWPRLGDWLVRLFRLEGTGKNP